LEVLEGRKEGKGREGEGRKMISWAALSSKMGGGFYSSKCWNQIISTEQVFEVEYIDVKNKKRKDHERDLLARGSRGPRIKVVFL